MNSKIFIIVIVEVLMLFGGIALFGNDSTQDQPQADSATTTAIQELADGQAVVIDVRTPQEYSELHADGAELFELTSLQQGLLPDHPKDQKIYVYCRSGARSATAANILREAGFINIIDIQTLTGWQNADGPTATGL